MKSLEKFEEKELNEEALHVLQGGRKENNDRRGDDLVDDWIIEYYESETIET